MQYPRPEMQHKVGVAAQDFIILLSLQAIFNEIGVFIGNIETKRAHTFLS